MSADAKAWPVDDEGYLWAGICDARLDEQTLDGYGLTEVLRILESQMGRRLRWTPHLYPDGRIGLRGFTG